MSATQITFQEVLQLVELIKDSANFSELRIRSGDIEVELRRASWGPGPAPVDGKAPFAPSPRADTGTVESPAPQQAGATAQDMSAADPRAAPGPSAARDAKASAPASGRAGAAVVQAPMVGTVYHAPEPGAPPFVRVGQRVAAGDQLCIIEVMKLMNAVTAECAGKVAEILVSDGEAVEFGQDLFVIEPR